MPMLRFLFRKMWNTRLLTFSTFVGLVLAVAFTTSIPMYADGALKNVVGQSLQQEGGGLPAGSLLMRYQAAGSDRADLDDFADVDGYIRDELPESIGFPVQTFARVLQIRGGQIVPEDPSKVDPSKRRQMVLAAMNDLPDHVELVGGSMYSDTIENGVVEAILFEEAMFRNDVHVGDIFRYPVAGGEPLRVKIVGVFRLQSDTDPYWFQGLEGLLNTLIVHESVMLDELLGKRNIPLNLANWYYAFDLRDIQTSRIPSLERKLSRLDITLYQKLKETRVDVSFAELLANFRQISLQLQGLLFTLAAPMIAMVLYFIVILSRQSLDRQRTDIAVIRSRGGSTRQILMLYLLEGLLLGGAALVIGMPCGWLMAKSIGSANGFLEFVDRKALPVGVPPEAYLYGLAAVLLAIAATVFPAIRVARLSIVGYKQKAARTDAKPVWEKWFLDVALVALAAFGWYLFNENQALIISTGLSSEQLQMHPLLFFVPAVTIFSIGLLFLRLFPLLLKLCHRLGRKFLSVSLHLSLVQLSRSARSYYPLMLLLVLTIGLGIYNSAAARTIDLNSTERTLYQYGTDVIIQPVWEGVAERTADGEEGPDGGQSGNEPRVIRYIEPPFEMFREMEGVKAAARVLATKQNVIVSGKSIGQSILLGIDNTDFAEVAWFRRDLFPHHPNLYLNQLHYYEEAAIIPTTLADKHGLEPGDVLTVTIQQQPVEFVIVATVPYWPGQYPNETPFIIANLEYIYDQVPLMPYEVWLKMEDGALTTPVLEAMQARGVDWASVKDVRIELARQGKHPSRGGVFGILSLGFLVCALITLIGYMLYWFFNLSSRVVQFGVLRAMGLKRKQLTFMLMLEQLLTAGLSIALGIGIGKLTSYLYLPFLQTAENAAKQVPPFRVVFSQVDNYALYAVVAVMVLTGAALLVLHIRRLRVHQAVKLGEER